MKLKNLILLKFVTLLITFFCSVYLLGNITDTYKTIEANHKILLEQKKTYEEIIRDPQAKQELLKIIKVSDVFLDYNIENEGFSFNTNIWILLIFWIVASYIFTILNSKIEKLKGEENLFEKNTFYKKIPNKSH
ncbi:hypothetical protein [Flavobacterium stagni]|uniref:Uncharacterized protein n=1 Tax=Flavobacterium stagni TaxID=2506421 RepID=A0A4Q1K3X5_9FLAO|nr:hypothetical protein [Flavobacterium stagni]RXR20257.1 hypothetical protein EQG61_12615 [Flavobacterium stagni]